jgi:hypothetical protein
MLPLHHIGVTLRFSPRVKWRTSVKRFCSNVRRNARPALVALAIPFAVLSFNHIERATAQSVTAAPFALMPSEFVDAGSLAVESLAASAEAGQTVCAICAMATTTNSALFAIPPLFLLPQAVELLNLTTGAELMRLRSPRAKHPS